MNKGSLILLVSLGVSTLLLVDSFYSFNSLSAAPKPLNYWYPTFACFLVLQCLTCIMIKFLGTKITDYTKKVLECIQLLWWAAIVVSMCFGYTWLIKSWYHKEESIPLRLKIEFLSILSFLTLVLFPICVICGYTIMRVMLHLNLVKRKSTQLGLLQDLHKKMYNPKFDFKKVAKNLSLDFYKFPLKDKEMELVLREFSVVLPESKEKSEGCAVCYNEFQAGETMTTVPICNHQLHHECFQLWVKTQHICPCCTCIIRKNMLEHFHGEYKIEEEKQKGKIKKPDQEVVIEISKNLSRNRLGGKLVGGADKC